MTRHRADGSSQCWCWQLGLVKCHTHAGGDLTSVKFVRTYNHPLTGQNLLHRLTGTENTHAQAGARTEHTLAVKEPT